MKYEFTTTIDKLDSIGRWNHDANKWNFDRMQISAGNENNESEISFEAVIPRNALLPVFGQRIKITLELLDE